MKDISREDTQAVIMLEPQSREPRHSNIFFVLCSLFFLLIKEEVVSLVNLNIHSPVNRIVNLLPCALKRN